MNGEEIFTGTVGTLALWVSTDLGKVSKKNARSVLSVLSVSAIYAGFVKGSCPKKVDSKLTKVTKLTCENFSSSASHQARARDKGSGD